MQVKNVFVEEIILVEPSRAAVVRAVLYNFDRPTWVSQHHERGKSRVGPMTVIENSDDRDEPYKMSVKKIRGRNLHQEGTSRLVISYRETWTAPPWTIFALVLPANFFASVAKLSDHDYEHRTHSLQVGSSDKGQLFYFGMLTHADTRHAFDVEARIEEDHDNYRRITKSSEVVKGTSMYTSLGQAVTATASRPDFWLKLLDVAGKLIRHP